MLIFRGVQWFLPHLEKDKEKREDRKEKIEVRARKEDNRKGKTQGEKDRNEQTTAHKRAKKINLDPPLKWGHINSKSKWKGRAIDYGSKAAEQGSVKRLVYNLIPTRCHWG